MPTLRLMADIALNKRSPDAAMLALQEARKINPFDAKTLDDFAAAHYLLDVQPGGGSRRTTDVIARKPRRHRGIGARKSFTFRAACDRCRDSKSESRSISQRVRNTLESRRKYVMAEKIYQHAIRVMPTTFYTKRHSACSTCRPAGRIRRSNFWTKLSSPIPTTSESAICGKCSVSSASMKRSRPSTSSSEWIRRPIKILGEYMAEYLEEVYPELVELYGYEPPQRSVFEIYNNAKGLDRASMVQCENVGLPWIQTIGASTGMMLLWRHRPRRLNRTTGLAL